MEQFNTPGENANTTDGISKIQSDTAVTSPSAKAFFAAFDGQQQKNRGSSSSREQPQSKGGGWVQKRISTLGWRNRYSQQDDYPVVVSSHSFSIRQVQRGELEGTYGTGATVWPASMVLVKYLERHADTLIRGKRIVDLGAGTGITSIAAALLQAKEVVCTDGEFPVVRLARDNIRACASSTPTPAITPLKTTDNALSQSAVITTAIESATSAAEANRGETVTSSSPPGTSATTAPSTQSDEGTIKPTGNGDVETFEVQGVPVHVRQYWWGSGVDLSPFRANKGEDCFDIILVSDCVLPKLYPIAPLVDALYDLLPPRKSDNDSAVAVISYEHRYFPEYNPKAKFHQLAEAKSLTVEQVPMEDQDEVYSVEDIEIWLVRRKRT